MGTSNSISKLFAGRIPTKSMSVDGMDQLARSVDFLRIKIGEYWKWSTDPVLYLPILAFSTWVE